MHLTEPLRDAAPHPISAAPLVRNDEYWTRCHTPRSSPASSPPKPRARPAWSHYDRSSSDSRSPQSYQDMLITLTTDFGNSDHFVGTMKGVILGIAPRARIVDITHEIAPYALNEAAFVIAQAWQSFPKRTIHVVVVDP